jgi:glycerol-3-phosphate O-acyltransferase/dihydroxyacetone phosphate acyltransferase
MTYHSLLKTSQLTNETLAFLPLPRNLDPRRPMPFPSRITTFLVLIRDTLSAMLRLPLFLVPLLVHFPIYAISRWVGRQSEEEETMAQNKVVVGLFGLLIAYGTMFWFIWALLGGWWINGVIAAFTVYVFGIYHVRLIDDNYLRYVPAPYFRMKSQCNLTFSY